MAKRKAAAAAEKKEMGRPSFQADDIKRGEVRALTVAGYTQGQVAEYLGIDEKTLRKHFEQELRFATMKVLANCVSNVVQLANGVPAKFDEKGNCIRAEIPMSLGPNAFILKTRGKALGWSERIEHTGKDGGDITHSHGVLDEVTRMVREELGTSARATKH
jgi:predicted transcriptional regulator